MRVQKIFVLLFLLAAAISQPVSAASLAAAERLDYERYMSRMEGVRTAEDIPLNGFIVIEEHIYEKGTFAHFGRADILPAIDPKHGRIVFFFCDEDGGVVYKTDDLECNNQRRGELNQPNLDVVGYGLRDRNGNGLMDLVIISRSVSRSGRYAGAIYLDEEKRFLAAQYIYREGKRLESLSLRLLDLIVLRRQEIEPKAVAVSALFSHVAETFPGDVTVKYKDGLVMAEPALLSTVLLNLVDNARKASKPGDMVYVRGWPENDRYQFAVLDNGKGIPEDELGRITEPFYMVDKSRSGSREGTGLGLSLCVRILELHNSRMDVSSIVGTGTCVTFSLPISEERL